ncbi:hypothetical protein BJY14_008452 [Actinomadura luteofluorescens]|uniref:Uncharacterized protein n=1 Tax=Actinomadura luteofluorescens TaxID=46163 RepID=A0A7Y9ER90_9ACTN|nr:hypothetical protein [Actinomadura luteofluorescens]
MQVTEPPTKIFAIFEGTSKIKRLGAVTGLPVR